MVKPPTLVSSVSVESVAGIEPAAFYSSVAVPTVVIPPTPTWRIADETTAPRNQPLVGDRDKHELRHLDYDGHQYDNTRLIHDNCVGYRDLVTDRDGHNHQDQHHPPLSRPDPRRPSSRSRPFSPDNPRSFARTPPGVTAVTGTLQSPLSN